MKCAYIYRHFNSNKEMANQHRKRYSTQLDDYDYIYDYDYVKHESVAQVGELASHCTRSSNPSSTKKKK
jgi:hypothetical protein